MRLLAVVALFGFVSSACVRPPATRIRDWLLDDAGWRPLDEHNLLELYIDSPLKYFTVMKEGDDRVDIECVRGCRCDGGSLLDVTEVPVSKTSCHVRFAAHGTNVTLKTVGDKCLALM